MPVPPFPTRTDGSLGRTKMDNAAVEDLDVQVQASEYETIATWLLTVINEIGNTDGSDAGSLWEAALAGAGAVTSVFARTGAVVAAASDYDASQIDNDSGVTGATVAAALDTLDAASAPVTDVFGRTGMVVAAASDYDASQIDNDSGVTGATVAAALDTLDAGIVQLPQLHDPTAGFGGNVLFCWQGDNGNTDETANHTMTTGGSPIFSSIGINASADMGSGVGNVDFRTATGTDHQRGINQAVSGYGLFLLADANSQSSPYMFYSGPASGAGAQNYALVSVSGTLNYQNSGDLVDTGWTIPRGVVFWAGFTRSAANVVNVYINDTKVTSGVTVTPPTPGGSDIFCCGSAGTAANGYWLQGGGGVQSIKLLDVELTHAQMIQEYRRAVGR